MASTTYKPTGIVEIVSNFALKRDCKNCGKHEEAVELPLCDVCGAVRYCSPKCQAADAKAHKKWCTKTATLCFMEAINRNDAATVLKLARIKQVLNDGRSAGGFGFQETPLHECVARKNAAMMKILLEQDDCIVDIPDSDDETPLIFALTCDGTAELVQMLLAAGADPYAGGWNPLPMALSTGDYDVVKVLLEYGIPVSIPALEHFMKGQAMGANITFRKGETMEQGIARCAKIHELLREHDKK